MIFENLYKLTLAAIFGSAAIASIIERVYGAFIIFCIKDGLSDICWSKLCIEGVFRLGLRF